MILGFFRKTDPVCGVKEEKDKGFVKHGKWFCSPGCLEAFEKKMSRASKSGGCCGH